MKKKINSVVESNNDFLDAEYTYFRYLPLNSKVAYFYSDFYNREAYKTKAQAVQVIKNLCIAFGYETIPFLPLTVEEILNYHELTMEEFEERVDKQFEGEITPSTVFYFRAEEDAFFYIGEPAEDIFDELLDEFFAAVYVAGVSKEFLRQVFDHLYIEFKMPSETAGLEWANESLTQVLDEIDCEALFELIERDFDKLPYEALHAFREKLDSEGLIDILYYFPFTPEDVAVQLEDAYLPLSDYYFTDYTANLEGYNGTIEAFYDGYTKYIKEATLSDINDIIQKCDDDDDDANEFLRPLLISLIEVVEAQTQEDLSWANETVELDDSPINRYIEDYIYNLSRELHPVGLSELFRNLWAVVTQTRNKEDELIESGMIFYNDTDNDFENYANTTGKNTIEKYIRISWVNNEIIEVIEENIYDWFKKNINIYVSILKLIAEHSSGHLTELSKEFKNHHPNPQPLIDDFARIVSFYISNTDETEVSWANESIYLNNKKKKEVNMITTQVGKMKIKNGKAIVESKVTTVNKGKPLPKITKADPRKSDKAKPKSSATKASLATTLENAKTKREFMNAGMEALGSALNTRKLLLSLWSAMKEQKPNAKELNNTLEGALKVKDTEKEAPKRELPKQRRRLEGPRVKKIEKTVKFSK